MNRSELSEQGAPTGAAPGAGRAGGTGVSRSSGSRGAELLRFARPERWVHHATAALFLVCLATAAALYVSPIAELVGRRYLVVTVHEWTGLALPLPYLVGLASKAFRRDLWLLNRFGPHDGAWLRARLWRRGRQRTLAADTAKVVGKFNAGQKVYAAFTAGAALVMLGTGLLMWFTGLAPLVWRTGATFVHDWLALAVGVAVAGHIGMAVRDREALRGILTGRVSRGWAHREHPFWTPDPQSTEQSPRQRPE